jgi:hypothetical protein
MISERCIDGSPHKFVLIESKVVEAGYRRWNNRRTFYCEKCLAEKTTETERTNP